MPRADKSPKEQQQIRPHGRRHPLPSSAAPLPSTQAQTTCDLCPRPYWLWPTCACPGPAPRARDGGRGAALPGAPVPLRRQEAPAKPPARVGVFSNRCHVSWGTRRGREPGSVGCRGPGAERGVQRGVREALRPALRSILGPPGPGESWSQQDKGGHPPAPRTLPPLRPGPHRLQRAGSELPCGGQTQASTDTPSSVLCVGTAYTGRTPHPRLCRSVPCPARGPGMAQSMWPVLRREQRAEGPGLPGLGPPLGLRWCLRTWTRVQLLSGFPTHHTLPWPHLPLCHTGATGHLSPRTAPPARGPLVSACHCSQRHGSQG